MSDEKLERIIEICGDAPLGHHADKFLAKKRAALEALDGPDVLLPIKTELTYPYVVLPNHGVDGGNTMFDVVRRVGAHFTREDWDAGLLYEHTDRLFAVCESCMWDCLTPLTCEYLDETLPENLMWWRLRTLGGGEFCFESYLEHNFYDLDAIAEVAGELLQAADCIARARRIAKEGERKILVSPRMARWFGRAEMSNRGVPVDEVQEGFYRDVAMRFRDMAESFDHGEYVLTIYGP